jgi:hypothetical protein
MSSAGTAWRAAWITGGAPVGTTTVSSEDAKARPINLTAIIVTIILGSINNNQIIIFS